MMAKFISFLLSLLLPGLIVGHVMTGIPTFEYTINIFVIITFIANAIMLAVSFSVGKRIPLERLHQLREHARNNVWRVYVGFIISTIMIYALYTYVNSFAGTVYVFSFCMLQMSRANVLNYFGPLHLRK